MGNGERKCDIGLWFNGGRSRSKCFEVERVSKKSTPLKKNIIIH